ncbi:MAG: hypothetical protein MUC50_21645, partial [Myxococcota bacterium]|nr:hypothetical protein [Myxococcota bacterium]
RVSTTTGECEGKTDFVCGTQDLTLFGMGFATEKKGGSAETLYLAGSQVVGGSSSGFAAVDLDDWSIDLRGDLVGDPEFTGNANGELWGFFPGEASPSVKQIDKEDGSVLETIVLDLPSQVGAIESAWAFAYWGGSFYVFYQHNQTGTSTYVYKVEYDGTMTTHIANSGKRIVGAGVSTCAPVVPI